MVPSSFRETYFAENFLSCSSNVLLESTTTVACSMSYFTGSLSILVLARTRKQIFFFFPVGKDHFKQESSKKAWCCKWVCLQYLNVLSTINIGCFYAIFRPNEIQKDLLFSCHFTLYLQFTYQKTCMFSTPYTAKLHKAPQYMSDCQVYPTCLSVRD